MKNRSIRARSAVPVFSVLSVIFATSVGAQVTEVNPVVISANRMPQVLSDVLPSVSVISRQDIDRSQAPSLADLLQGEAGFEFGRNGGPGAQTSFFLRGHNSTNVVVLIDGVRTQTDSGGNLTVTDLPLALIERIEVLRGNAGALYGEAAVGGVINIYTRQFKGAPAPFGSVGLGARNTMDINTGYAGNLSDYNFNFMVGKTSTDSFSAMSSNLNGRVNPDKDGHSNTYASARVDKKISPDSLIGLRLRSTESKTDYDSGFAQFLTDRHTSIKDSSSVGVFVKTAISDQWVSTIDVSNSSTAYQETLARINPLIVTNSGQFKSTQDAINWSNSYHLTKKSVANFGVDLIGNTHEQLNSFQLKRQTTAAFLGFSHRFDRLSTQFNLRHDDITIERSSLLGASKIKPNATTALLGLGYQMTPVWKLTTTASSGFKAPSAYDISTNQSINSESYTSREAGLVYSTTETVARMVVFSSSTDNAIGYDRLFKAINVGETRNSGVEISLRTSWLGNNLRLNYVDQNPQNLSTGQPLDRRASNYGSVDLSRSFAGYDVGTRLYASSARPEFGSSLGGYALLSLYASRKINESWTARLRLENLTDKRYEIAGGYNTPGRGVFASMQYIPKR